MEIPQRKIKHIVVSGGSIWGFSAFGMLYQAITTGFLNMDDVKTIHSTSAGSIISVMLSLKIDHNLLKEYLIQRPWETVCKKNRCSVLEIFENRGVINNTFFENMFSPLLKSVDLDVSTTMLDLYNYNGIEIHIFVTELNKYELIDMSYKTHPEWRIVDAIHSSCCIPLIFSPIIKDDCCYIDGGFLLNYPISKCLENLDNQNQNQNQNVDEILGISLANYKIGENDQEIIRENSNVIDLLNSIVYKTIHNMKIHTNINNIIIPYEMREYAQPVSLDDAFAVLYNKEERQKLVEFGINKINDYMNVWFS